MHDAERKHHPTGDVGLLASGHTLQRTRQHRAAAEEGAQDKCYDSLPLVKLLCPHIKVPLVGECDKRRCLHAFQRLDAAYCRGEPFVSYLFALEFIFRMIGRSDMVPFINKISCRLRRIFA